MSHLQGFLALHMFLCKLRCSSSGLEAVRVVPGWVTSIVPSGPTGLRSWHQYCTPSKGTYTPFEARVQSASGRKPAVASSMCAVQRSLVVNSKRPNVIELAGLVQDGIAVAEKDLFLGLGRLVRALCIGLLPLVFCKRLGKGHKTCAMNLVEGAR
jgi:hypothetical protein